MRKIIFIGRSEAGKTSLTQAMKGEHITYHKTQYVNNYDVIIDTPGEYAETKTLGGALAVYSYEADVVGLLLSAIEPYSLYPPNVTTLCNREVIGIVTKIDHPQANVRQAEEWLRLAGCEKIFRISSYTGEGVPEYWNSLRRMGTCSRGKRLRSRKISTAKISMPYRARFDCGLFRERKRCSRMGAQRCFFLKTCFRKWLFC